ncbi:MAG: hypothetical protein RLY78_3379 [Pseudomonadota bacterium]
MHFLHHVLSALTAAAALAAATGSAAAAASSPTGAAEPAPAAASATAASPALRCGWFVNPTPGNAWLIDRDGEWVIGLQGGHQADGDWPIFSAARWVRDNGHYGHGCACLRMTADPHTRQVLRIDEAASRPLAVCRRDRRLPRP